MNATGLEHGRAGAYHPDQFVVALPHLGEVLGALDVIGAHRVDPVETSEPLGLGLVELTNLAQALAALRRSAAEPGTASGSAGNAVSYAEFAAQAAVADAGASRLDQLLYILRTAFGRRHGGWTPTLGKNRIVEGIEGLPEIGGGGEGDPEPLKDGFTDLFTAPPERGRGVRVGILDTRLYAHPRLTGRFVADLDTLLPPAHSPAPSSAGHATFIAGLVLRHAPAAELDVRAVLRDSDATARAWDVARKMVEFADSGVAVLNLSFGCATDDGTAPLLLARAVDRLSPQIVLVAAAGNHARAASSTLTEEADASASAPATRRLAPDDPIWPAALDDVVAVGAHDANGDPAPFSPRQPWVDLTAAGVAERSTYLEGPVRIQRKNSGGQLVDVDKEDFPTGYARWSGTSFAAANVSGELAARTLPGHRSAREVLHEMSARPSGPGRDAAKPFTTR